MLTLRTLACHILRVLRLIIRRFWSDVSSLASTVMFAKRRLKCLPVTAEVLTAAQHSFVCTCLSQQSFTALFLGVFFRPCCRSRETANGVGIVRVGCYGNRGQLRSAMKSSFIFIASGICALVLWAMRMFPHIWRTLCASDLGREEDDLGREEDAQQSCSNGQTPARNQTPPLLLICGLLLERCHGDGDPGGSFGSR